MGLIESRQEEIDIEFNTKNRTDKFYETEEYTQNFLNSQHAQRGTLTFPCNFTELFSELLKEIKKEKLNVLEVGSGNGHNSLIIKNIFENNKRLEKFVATDLLDHESKELDILTGFPSEEAVKKFGKDTDVLLLVCPPPNCYVDYYAIKEFEETKTNKTKYVIFIGELGASDGGKGMYKYMTEKSKWKTNYRKILKEGLDCFGGEYIKELFLFEFDYQTNCDILPV